MKKAKHLRKVISLVLTFLILMSVTVTGFCSVSAAENEAAQTGADTRIVYFSSNGYWNNLYAVYAWTEGTDASEWKQLDKVEDIDGLWSVELSTSYTDAVFCSRTYPGFTWSAVDEKTDELSLEGDYNYLSLTSDTTGVWGYYNSGDQSGSDTATQKVYFTPNEEWTNVQGSLYHDFVVRAYSDTDTDGVLIECSLVEGAVGQYPSVWSAEIPADFDNVSFLRAESTVANGWYVWEKTDDQTIPADSNLFTQYDDVQTGTWSYYTEPEAGPDTPADPDTPDTPVVPGETQTLYFIPNAEWFAYTENDGRISAASAGEDGVLNWVFAEVVSEGIYSVDIPADDTSVIFGVSFGETPDLTWAKTESQTIPATDNLFTQDSVNAKTGTWSVYGNGAVAGVYYSVAFVNWDGTLLSAQAVVQGGSATAPSAPERKNDAQYKYTFKGWDKAFDNVTSDMIITAQYDRTELPPTAEATTGKLRVELAGGNNFTIAVNDGAARPQGASYVNTKMPIGAEVKVVANTANGLDFLGWMNEAGAIVSVIDTYTFATSGNDYLKAVFKTEVEGVNSVVFKNAKAAGGNGQILEMQYYAAGDEIVFPDAPAQAGYTFTGWSHTDADIQQKLTAGEDVVVTAIWEVAKVYIDVDVTGGTISTEAQTNGKYLAYKKLTVVADAASAGMKFAYWTDAKGTILSYDETYESFPAQSTELTAVFVAESETIAKQPLVFLAADPTTDGEKITYTMSWDINASIGKVTAAGLIVVDANDYNAATFKHGSGDSKLFDRTVGSTQVKQQNIGYGISLSSRLYDHTYYAATFVIYTDATSGESVTVYSDMVETYKQAP